MDSLLSLSQAATTVAIVAEAAGTTELPGSFTVVVPPAPRTGPFLTPCWFDDDGNPETGDEESPEGQRIPELFRNGKPLTEQDLLDLSAYLPEIREMLGIHF